MISIRDLEAIANQHGLHLSYEEAKQLTKEAIQESCFAVQIESDGCIAKFGPAGLADIMAAVVYDSVDYERVTATREESLNFIVNMGRFGKAIHPLIPADKTKTARPGTLTYNMFGNAITEDYSATI